MCLRMPGSARWFRVAYGVWLWGIFAYFVPAATWNPVSRFDLTRAIVEEGSLRIDPYADNTGDRSRRDEHWYTDKAPLPAFLAVPAYAAVRGVQAIRGQRPTYQTI